MNPKYLEFLHSLIKLHVLISDGLTDSPEADAIRDGMDPLWECLSVSERRTAQVISEALYSSYEGGTVMSNLTAQEFFEQLTWEKFKTRLSEALHNPHANVPQRIQCPAVMALFRDIAQNIGETAIQKTDEPLTTENIFHLDQRLALLRILEALVRMAEEGPVSSGGSLKLIPESPIMKGLGNRAHE
jgi:hypothetical protein